MEIKNTLTQSLGSYTNRLAKGDSTIGRASTTQAGALSVKGDTVSVSPEAKLRTEAFSSAMSAPEVRQEKIDAIKTRISEGTYTADSRQIASKLLKENPGLFKY